ncbi:interferon lambda receptor 1 [Hoplias malabaricus]|uniref:interferon lambda receptor 1 n=1 Tax=Hoplias malabaricus TaxID=27720 RepID=UPI0034637858
MGPSGENRPLPALLLLLCCSGFWCQDCNQTRLHIVSRNFYSVLHWDKVDVPGQDVLYSVQYTEYGNPWKPMMQCQNMSETHCDLSSVITDVYQRHFARVMVRDKCAGMFLSFVLSEQTVLDAPKVSVSVESESSFSVHITPPTGPQNLTIRELSRDRQGDAHLNYGLQLLLPASRTGQEHQNISGVITVRNLEENMEYCGTAFYLLTHPSSMRRSENTSFCVTLPGRSWAHVLVAPGLIALFLLLLLVLVPCQLYITRKTHLPPALMIPKSRVPPFHPSPKLEIDKVRIYSEFPWKMEKPDPDLKLNVGSIRDVDQDGSGLPWRCNSYATQQVVSVENYDPNSESITSYSMVVSSLVPEDLESLEDAVSFEIPAPTSSFSTGDGADAFQSLIPELEAPEQDGNDVDPSLVLSVIRDPGGKLELSFPPEPLSPSKSLSTCREIQPPGEQTALLNDLSMADETERQDSGISSDYGRAYFQQSFSESPSSEALPLLPLSNCTSGYRENWVPGMPQETPQNVEGFPGRTVTTPLDLSSDCVSNYKANWVPGMEIDDSECSGGSEGPSACTIPLVSLSNCVSNYTTNWIPGITLASQINPTVKPEPCPDLEENSEEQKLSSNFEVKFLEGWVVQIQG